MNIQSPKPSFRKLLNKYQIEVLDECLEKKNGGLSVPMGYGKTLLSIVLGLEIKKNNPNPMLVVVSKTLIGNWIFEITKFFGEKGLRYQVLHQDYTKNLDICEVDLSLDLILISVDVVSKFYKKADIETQFVKKIIVNEGHFNQHVINKYDTPIIPYINVETGCYVLYSIIWSCLIVDEIQTYTNITSNRCKGLGAICATNRWALSGTIFDEPKAQKILGYYVIIGDKTFPRTLPETQKFIINQEYKGYQTSTVYRNINSAYTPPKLIEITINHKMVPEEEILYTSVKNVMIHIQKEFKKFKAQGNVAQTRKFGSYLLAALCYLRQAIISPILPMAKAALDISDLECKSELSKLLVESIDKLKIKTWMEQEESAKSSRITEIIKVINKHDKERVIMFTCFRTNLNLIKYFLSKTTKRPIFTLTTDMSSKKRTKTLKEFEEENDSFLMLTYELGSVGLNLQLSHTILLADFWWNDGKTQQSIARVLRYGQKSLSVNVYYFMSNTGVEQAVFNKQHDKLTVLSELRDGPQTTKVKKINVHEIIKFIDQTDNERLMERIRNHK